MCGCETWLFTLTEKHGKGLFSNGIVMDIWDSEGQGNLKVKETADSLVDFVLHCITRVFMTVLLTKYECGDQVKNNETGVE